MTVLSRAKEFWLKKSHPKVAWLDVAFHTIAELSLNWCIVQLRIIPSELSRNIAFLDWLKIVVSMQPNPLNTQWGIH
jgi:hypothetical protein